MVHWKASILLCYERYIVHVRQNDTCNYSLRDICYCSCQCKQPIYCPLRNVHTYWLCAAMLYHLCRLQLQHLRGSRLSKLLCHVVRMHCRRHVTCRSRIMKYNRRFVCRAMWDHRWEVKAVVSAFRDSCRSGTSPQMQCMRRDTYRLRITTSNCRAVLVATWDHRWDALCSCCNGTSCCSIGSSCYGMDKHNPTLCWHFSNWPKPKLGIGKPPPMMHSLG